MGGKDRGKEKREGGREGETMGGREDGKRELEHSTPLPTSILMSTSARMF